MGAITTWIDKEMELALEDFRQKKGLPSKYAAQRLIFEEHLKKCEKENKTDLSFRDFEEEIKQKSLAELQSIFDKLGDKQDRKSTKEKKNMAWGPDRFYHEVHDLEVHRAPPYEMIYFLTNTAMLSAVADELARRGIKVPSGYLVDWKRVHWEAAKTYPDKFIKGYQMSRDEELAKHEQIKKVIEDAK